MKKIKRDEEKGAMGVGTLIVFIALVLVSAVAASVIIDTANQLQQQAERTGDDAISEVASSFQVLDAYGKDVYGGGTIDNLTLKIGLAAGAEAQNLEQTIIQVRSADWEVNLQAADHIANSPDSERASEENYSWKQIILQEEDPIDRDKPFVKSGDLYAITIDLKRLELDDSVDSGEGPLGTQEELDIDIIPKHGTPTYENIVAPPTITSDITDL